MMVYVNIPYDLSVIGLLLIAWLATLHLNAPPNRCAGIVENLATWPVIVQMKAFAIPVVKLDTVPESAQLLHCLQGT